MTPQPAAGKTASQLMAATMVVSMIGIFFGIYLLFVNTGLAFRVLAAILDWGSLACGITLFTYGTYLFCTFSLHLRQAITPGTPFTTPASGSVRYAVR